MRAGGHPNGLSRLCLERSELGVDLGRVIVWYVQLRQTSNRGVGNSDGVEHIGQINVILYVL